jgi:3-ketoacyl-CoA synthase
VEIIRTSRMPPLRDLLHYGSSVQLKRLKPLYLMIRSRAVYQVDFACFRTKPNCRVPFATFLEHSRVWPGFDEHSVRFMMWLLERSRLGEETCLPYVQHYIPPLRDHESSRAEAELVIFSAIDDLIAKTGHRERAHGGAPP